MEAFYQIQAADLFDEVYGSMLNGKKNNKTNYNELGKRQHCTAILFRVVKTWSKSLFWNLYYKLGSIVSMDIQHYSFLTFLYTSSHLLLILIITTSKVFTALQSTHRYQGEDGVSRRSVVQH